MKLLQSKIMLRAALIGCMCFALLENCSARSKEPSFDDKLDALAAYVFAQQGLEQTVRDELKASYGSVPPFTVLFSISDGEKRATVLTGTGASLRKAWDAGADKARNYVTANNYKPVYLKADIVNNMQAVKSEFIPTLAQAEYFHHFFRKGIAFDQHFETAFLEAEINGNALISYKEGQFSLENINSYLKNSKGAKKLKSIPKDAILFTCRGYIYDGGECFPLYYAQDLTYGRRIIDTVDAAYINTLIANASQFLVNNLDSDGKFVYGYYPRFDRELPSYNIIRHISAIWSLLHHYRTSKDPDLVPKIDAAINYFLGAVVYKDANTAFIEDAPAKELKLGANAVAIIALTDYMNVLKSDKYRDLIEKLGNGILSLLDTKTGKYYHVLNYKKEGTADFSRKEEFRIVYYDGEATFALMRLYENLHDAQWLTAAKSAVENFIANDYTQHVDHWVAYSMNEITKYVSDERYFEFALRNADVNLETIYKRETSFHTYLELLMGAFEVYDRIIEQGIAVKYLDTFDAKRLLETIFHRADFMLNGYFYPEYAIYMKNPNRIMNTFFVRHHDYRVRIDDVEHFVSGYYNYARLYGKLRAHEARLKRQL
ncbi:hypothetical protein SAMD00024442_14_11 [Candidatus Symbiothrix dinenymphae]|nr:hypothetical protein SAMD00024442_14_11 [Candidatus Symbiothrix dinenymphae]